jgi:hypothetical protein
VNPKRLWKRIQQGSVHNIAFDDFVRLVQAFGFDFERQRGSHQIYRHPLVVEKLNLQPLRDGSAKPYQVRDLASLVDRNDLRLKGEEDV